MNKRKKYRINKLRLFSTIMIFTLLIVILIMGIKGFVSNAEEITSANVCIDYKMIEVAEGDSLWSIARSCETTESDLRKTVETICRINMLENSMIYPGQVLMIPDA